MPDDLRPGEQQLLAALRAGEPCDLLDDSRVPTSDEIAKWRDPARIVRADVLRAVLLDQYPQTRPDSVALRGAIIDGDLKLTGDLRPSVRFQHCRIANAWFDGATFTDLARFDGATFTGAARFDGATFTGAARFDRLLAKNAAASSPTRAETPRLRLGPSQP